MAHKSPKNICYSLSKSSSFRLASSVCTKNDGESSILEIRKNLGLSSGLNTDFYAKQADLKRTIRSDDAKLPEAKKRRISSAQAREKLKKTNEKVEGIQYQSNFGFSESVDTSHDIDDSQLESTQIKITSETCNLVYFDLETSGFCKNDEILQIAASCEGRKFSIYINPTKRIDDEASVHTGLKNIKGDLYFRGKKVLSVPIKDALESFLQFLNLSSKSCVLVAHNVSFDKSHLLRAILKCSVVQKFSKISGFSDSLPLFKKCFGVKKVSGEFKLSTLAAEHLNVTSQDQFHEAMTFLNHLTASKMIASAMQDLSPLKGVVYDHILKKIASEGIKYSDLLNKYQKEDTEKFKEYLKNPDNDKKARISKDKSVIDKLVKFFKEKL
ncbi:hypothetical protein KQX54_010658 [Cotesia glomerata]|uniref:Exonuclease domain-containing protein n=1 Tax=Cotesia glomerata TaxID=32391 RepID=A0AAV7I2Q5_COTGL|nr:hypothetical protein KQX54_010658 [Cotesia glomerata]